MRKSNKCKVCGKRLSPLMSTYHKGICENCNELKQMEANGDLAKNGLSIIDLM